MSLPNEVVFRPIPGSSQELALDSRAHDTLYTGARGPGKTITQLMRFRRHVGKGYGSYWRGIIFDREFKNLSDLVVQSKRFFPKFGDGAKFLSSQSEYKWVWPTGEELLFRHVKKIGDYDSYHGHEYPFIGWNELTKQPTSELFDKMQSTNRSSFDPVRDTPRVRPGGNGGPEWTAEELAQNGVPYDTPDGKPLPPIPLERFSTCNPQGPGHNWVKRRYITIAPYGTVVKTVMKDVFNPQTGLEEDFVMTQVAIFGSPRENIYLSAKYMADLMNIKDKNLKAAWLYGSWDVNSGGALDDLWNSQIHVIPRFRVPENWHVDRSFDWGSTHPFSVGWWAEANGEEVSLLDGSTWCPPRGTLIQISEIYGTEEIGSNKGTKLSPTDIALKIKAREARLLEDGWIKKKPSAGPADNQIANKTQIDVESIEQQFLNQGVAWEKSDKSAGSRKNGLQLMRDRLEAAANGEGAGLYFMVNCQASIQILPYLPRDEDDTDDIDCWIAGTKVSTPNGNVNIEDLKIGDLVETPIGVKKVLKSYVSGLSETYKVKLSNGETLEGTPGHKIFVCGKGLVPLDQLQNGDVLNKAGSSWLQNWLSIAASNIAGMTGDYITLPALASSRLVERACTDRYGSTREELSLKGFMSTIKTMTMIIMSLIITNVFHRLNMPNFILKNVNKFLLSGLLFGEQATMEKKFFETTQEKCGKERLSVKLRAEIVALLLLLNTKQQNTALQNAQKKQAENKFSKIVKFVVKNFGLNAMLPKKSKPVHIVAVGLCDGKKPVFNITVDEARLFYANGVLSSNTDAEDHPYDMARYRIAKGSIRAAMVIPGGW